MSRCIIFSAGSFFGLNIELSENDYVIAADAGYLYCLQMGISPDVIIGDFDSMTVPESDLKTEIFPAEKDDTDTILAIKKGMEYGCTEFHIYGGTGGNRIDHTVANLQSLSYISSKGFQGYLYHDSFVFTVIHNETFKVNRVRIGSLLSVFCVGNTAKNVTLSGVQYPLNKADIDSFFPIGVSNHIIDEKAEISVEDGYLLIGYEI